MKIFISKIQAIQNFLDDGLFEVVGAEAVSHYRASFRDQGFTDKSKGKWKNVQRRTNPRDASKAAAKRPILTGSGELGNSIHWRRSLQDVEIYSDKIYAEVHNKGLRAGRGKGFQMPKRQFIGKSEALTRKISKKVAQRLNAIK